MEELMQLSADRLKEVSQKILHDLYPAGPTRDGKLIPLDAFEAYRNGAADHVEFLIGVARNERQVYKSVVGKQTYEDFITNELDIALQFLDTAIP